MGHRLSDTSSAPVAGRWLHVAKTVTVTTGIALATAAGAQEPASPEEARGRVGVIVELRGTDDPELPRELYEATPGAATADVAAPPPASEWMEQQVEAVEDTLREARFRSALGISAQLRRHPAASRQQRVRLELVHATAALALGEEESSQASLSRLLDLEPDFELGEAHSPKLRRALERARGGGP